MSKDYQKSIDLYLKDQEKNIAVLELSVSFLQIDIHNLEKEINAKKELLQLRLEALEHEKKSFKIYKENL